MSMFRVCVLLFFLVLSAMPVVAVIPSKDQDVWRVDSESVARQKDCEQYFSQLNYYRWQENRWVKSDGETYFQSQQPDIPLIILVPGYDSDTSQVTEFGFEVLRTFDPQKPCRVLFWDWYSEKEVCRIRNDMRGKLPIIETTADYLALFLQKTDPQSKVCLFGFSFGSRVICHAMETLRKSNQMPEGMRLHLILSGAAADQHLFVQGRQYSRIAEIAEKILVTYNPEDWALHYYPLMYGVRSRAVALGYEGLPMRNIAPEFRDRFENVNINRYIGSEHRTVDHVQSPPFRNRIGAYFFFE